MEISRIAPCICRIPASEEPLSADVFIIEGDAGCYVFDVGANDAVLAAISALEKPVTVILSHFHRDHIANTSRLNPTKILAGIRTCKYVSPATPVGETLVIRDGVEIVVRPCVSPHAPGCLIATVNGEYTLIGDLSYARPGTGQGEAKGMLNTLRTLDTQYFIPSHVQGNPMVKKNAFFAEIKAYFGL